MYVPLFNSVHFCTRRLYVHPNRQIHITCDGYFQAREVNVHILVLNMSFLVQNTVIQLKHQDFRIIMTSDTSNTK